MGYYTMCISSPFFPRINNSHNIVQGPKINKHSSLMWSSLWSLVVIEIKIESDCVQNGRWKLFGKKTRRIKTSMP